MGKSTDFQWGTEAMSGKECVSFKVMLVEDDEGFRRSLASLLTSRFPDIVLDRGGERHRSDGEVESFLLI